MGETPLEDIERQSISSHRQDRSLQSYDMNRTGLAAQRGHTVQVDRALYGNAKPAGSSLK